MQALMGIMIRMAPAAQQRGELDDLWCMYKALEQKLLAYNAHDGHYNAYIAT